MSTMPDEHGDGEGGTQPAPGRHDRCAEPAALEQAAEAGELPPPLAEHVSDCPACRLAWESALADARFLSRARALSASSLPPAGAPRLAGYRTLGVVSSGSQGVVYRAVQESTSRTVAIKTLVAGEGATVRQRARAEREVEIAASLRHPNIVTIFESRKLEDGRIAVVMEFVDGVPLDCWNPTGETAAERRAAMLGVFISVCGAIHHSHLAGVIHRDLKPDNILVTPDGRPVVLDFGIAKTRNISGTMTGEFAGTPAYASPEQVAGHPDEVNALTEVYSLGVILYRLLTGAMPYEITGGIFDIAQTIASTPPTNPVLLDASISSDLRAVVLRALAKDRAERYQSAAALAADLERCLAGEPVDARRGSGWYLLRKAVVVNRRRLALVAAGVVLLAVSGGAVWLSTSRAAASARQAALQQEQAHQESVRARAVTELLRETMPAPSSPARELQYAGIVGNGLGRLYLKLETNSFSQEPEVDLAVRRLWGGVYTGFGGARASNMIEYAELALRHGITRLKERHPSGLWQDNPEVAGMMHELAGVLLVRKRLPEAEEICRQVLAMRRKSLGVSGLAVAESEALLARILLARGETAGAIAVADVAIGQLRGLPAGRADALLGSMLAVRGRIELDAGRLAAAEPLVREGLSLRLRSLPPRDSELLASLLDAAELARLAPACDLAGIMIRAWQCGPAGLAANISADIAQISRGDLTTVERIVRTGRTASMGRLVALHRELVPGDTPSLVNFLMAHMQIAEDERENDVRVVIALQAGELLGRMYGRTHPSVMFCVDQAASIYAFENDPGRSVELGQRVCEIQDLIPPEARDPLLAANSRRRLGWFLTLAGRHAEAVTVTRHAVKQLEAVVGHRHHTVALAMSSLAFSLAELGGTEQLREADTLSAEALQIVGSLPQVPLDQLAHMELARGHVLFTLGRSEEAAAWLQLTWDQVYRCISPAFAWRRLLIGHMAALAERRGDSNRAAEWLAELERECLDEKSKK